MRPSPKAFVFLGVSLSALLVGCASKSINPHPAKLDPNDEKLMILNQQVTDQGAEIAKLTAAVDALAARIRHSERPEPVAKAPVPTRQKVARLHPDDQDESEDFTLEPADEEGDEASQDAIASKPSHQRDDLEAATETIVPSEADAGATVADSAHETMQLYYRGLQLLEEKRYDEALKNLRAFLKLSPDHVYADRAEYLISQAHFMNKEYGLVVVETNLLESRYPYSVRLPEALYKRALAYEGMGQQEQARRTLRDFLSRFPKDPLAGEASRRLGEVSLAEPSHEAPTLLNNVE